MMGTKTSRHVIPIAVLALAIAAGACNQETKVETAPARKVVTLGERDVALVEHLRLDAGIPISGTLEPSRSADVKAQIAGTITGVRTDAGTPVGAGQTLGVITAEGIRSQATGAQASIAAAQANLRVARQRAEALRQLFQEGAAAKIDYDNARAAVEAAEAQLTIARANLSGAQEQVRRAVITSPLTGIVSARYVNDGEAVTSAQRLFTIVNASTLKLSGKVSVDQRAAISIGQAVSVVLSSDSSRPVHGRVARIEPVADQQSRQVGVHVEIANPGSTIVAGQFVTGTILTSGATVATVVPIAAVRTEGTNEYVYVVSQGSIIRRNITTTSRDEARGIAAIGSGVNAGEVVVITPTVEATPDVEVRLTGTLARTNTPDSTKRAK